MATHSPITLMAILATILDLSVGFKYSTETHHLFIYPGIYLMCSSSAFSLLFRPIISASDGMNFPTHVLNQAYWQQINQILAAAMALATLVSLALLERV